MRSRLAIVLGVLIVASACSSSSKDSSGNKPPLMTTSAPTATGAQPTAHVFVINLENEDYASSWAANSPAVYLNKTLRPQGKLLTQYYGVGHASLDNYIAQLSGQPPNPQTRGDCVVYTEYKNGSGCVYPASVPTLASQLTAAHHTWKTYQEDMGTPCRHPVIGQPDKTLVARKGDMYATRHNPFVYFHGIIDTPACAANVVDLKHLDDDLLSAAATPNLVYITPNLCHDGHDSPCVDGEPGGLKSADQFLAQLVPKILSSPAYTTDGVLIITFDEAELTDASTCCGAAPPGGGRIGALVTSARTKPGTTDPTPYNHYSLLCSIENQFGLAHIGKAATKGLHCFGKDVYDAS